MSVNVCRGRMAKQRPSSRYCTLIFVWLCAVALTCHLAHVYIFIYMYIIYIHTYTVFFVLLYLCCYLDGVCYILWLLQWLSKATSLQTGKDSSCAKLATSIDLEAMLACTAIGILFRILDLFFLRSMCQILLIMK